MNLYNEPDGSPSTIDGATGKQMNTYFWQRKALIDAAKEMYFTPLADVTSMPKHYGKTIKVHHYVPLLDERNINDQGIDAAGVVMTGAAGANPGYGNLYGSSKDIGTITGKLPTLSEVGGRVNRVGFTRITREGSISQFGFFTEFTQESLDFDSDEELYAHMSRELVTGATQLTEAVLQKDLLAGAGIIVYTGDAVSDVTMDGESADIAEVTYEDLMRLARTLNDNRTPLQTKIITGSRMVDTKVISAGRILYIGSELEMTVKAMRDLFNDPAFIPVSKYAAGGAVLNGEIGTVDAFRIVVVPEMLHWADAGAVVTVNPGYVSSGTKYDIFPMLVIGDASFTTIGFQTGGKMMKFKIINKMPGDNMADRTDPFGLMGFSSIRWYYGTMLLRPERIAVVKTLARI